MKISRLEMFFRRLWCFIAKHPYRPIKGTGKLTPLVFCKRCAYPGFLECLIEEVGDDFEASHVEWIDRKDLPRV